MTIAFQVKPGQRIIELGGGSVPRFRPNVDIRDCYDEQGNRTTDFTANFEEALPIQSDEWDGVFSHFAIEHISYTKVPFFISEIFRIIKPGGRCCIVTADTLAQLKWIQANPNGWDGKDFFTSASEILFGSQDYLDNTHKSFFSHEILSDLFHKAGFINIQCLSYGARDTDVCITAQKPPQPQLNGIRTPEEALAVDARKAAAQGMAQAVVLSDQPELPKGSVVKLEPNQVIPKAKMFDKRYFHGGNEHGGYKEGYRDYSYNWKIFQHILYRKPASVLELGCARGYLVKRIQDWGIPAVGLDISQHAYMTRACEYISRVDLLNTPWPQNDQGFDLSFSINFLECIPESQLYPVLQEMGRVCKRHFHAVDIVPDPNDQTRVTIKPLEWWKTTLSNSGLRDWEIVNKQTLLQGEVPAGVLEGDGKLKLNLGSFINMSHWGWQNLDILDLTQFSQVEGYRFQKQDLKQGLPSIATGSVSLIFTSHMLEHFDYAQGLNLLRECRRVMVPSPESCIRIIVPNASILMGKHVVGDAWEHLYEISDGVENAPTSLRKMWEILLSGHQAVYDEETLHHALKEAGFIPATRSFRQGHSQIVKECTDIMPEISLIVEGTPLVG